MKTIILTLVLGLLGWAAPAANFPDDGKFTIVTLPGAGFTVHKKTALTDSWVYAQSYTANANGEVFYTNVPASGNSVFTRYCMTNTGLAAGNYRTNIYGSLKFTFPPGMVAFVPPFNPFNDYVTNVFDEFPTGVMLVQTSTGNSGYTTNYNDPSTGWSQPLAKYPYGKGVFVLNTNSSFTAAFTGILPHSSVANTPSGTYSFRGSKIPQAGYLFDLGFDNDADDAVSVHLWSGSAWVECYWSEAAGWDQITGFDIDAEKGPWIAVGQAIMIEKHGSANPTWNQSAPQ